MSRCVSSLLLLLLVNVNAPAARPDSKEAARKLATTMVEAFLKKNFDLVVDHTYAAVVEDAGGHDAMVRIIEKGTADMEEKGYRITSAKIGDAGDIYTAEDRQFLLLPETLVIEFGKGKLIARSYLLGISADQGRTWTFVEGTNAGGDARKLLPKLPDNLKLPEMQKPIYIPKR